MPDDMRRGGALWAPAAPYTLPVLDSKTIPGRACMRLSFRFVKDGLAAGLVLSLFSGCALQLPIKDPKPSGIAYGKSGSPAAITLNFKDQRSDADKAAVTGGIVVTQLLYQG